MNSKRFILAVLIVGIIMLSVASAAVGVHNLQNVKTTPNKIIEYPIKIAEKFTSGLINAFYIPPTKCGIHYGCGYPT